MVVEALSDNLRDGSFTNCLLGSVVLPGVNPVEDESNVNQINDSIIDTIPPTKYQQYRTRLQVSVVLSVYDQVISNRDAFCNQADHELQEGEL